ncbi:perlucin-like [Ylistrum balloti]|uniref:perlucin-like n=1 Tax=Ylistrum balloti TaxID=509963 RepID=UPI002905F5DA|nr:perlucin-like [Ylistrum balloti]
MLRGLSALLLCCSITLVLSEECPEEEWKRFGYSCFFFGEIQISWLYAQYFCHSMPGVNAHLAYIFSEEENAFIKDRLNFRNYDNSYHIGATDMNREGTFYWEKNDTLLDDSYTNWSFNEPNNAGSNEDCSEMNPRTGKWNDIPCTEAQRFICRMEI